MIENRKQMLLVISGPSGTGKGTLANLLLEHDPSFSFSVSVTTRPKRDYEIEGVHYFFISDEEYDQLLEKDAFLEHATVHGNRYGTLKSQVSKLMAEGKNVLLDIDPQGARQVLKNADDCVSILSCRRASKRSGNACIPGIPMIRWKSTAGCTMPMKKYSTSACTTIRSSTMIWTRPLAS